MIGASGAPWAEVGRLLAAPILGASIDANSARADLNKVLAKCKVPEHVLRIDALSCDGAGTVLETSLRELARGWLRS